MPADDPTMRDDERAKEEAKRAKRRAADKAYYENNREAKRAKSKAYYHAIVDKEARRARDKAYRTDNAEEIKAYQEAYKADKREALAAKQKAYRDANLEACRAREKAYRAANREAFRARYRKSNIKCKYGLTQDEFDAMLAKQKDRCLICRSTFALPKKTPHVDHCHDTGKVRGLLCNPCNAGMGFLGDDPKLLIRAAKYIRAARLAI